MTILFDSGLHRVWRVVKLDEYGTPMQVNWEFDSREVAYQMLKPLDGDHIQTRLVGDWEDDS